MKKTVLVFLTTFWLQSCFSLKAQTISFGYDEGGNLTERKLQVLFQGRMAKFDQPKDSNQIEAPNFKVFPNPTSTFINIEGNLPEKCTEAKLLILNMSGQALLQDSYLGVPKSINVEAFKSGMYLLEFIYSKEKKSTYKIIVTN